MSHPNNALLQQREVPREILEGVWMWSTFSEDKGFYFNGFAFQTSDGVVVVDPPSATPPVFDALAAIGKPVLVIVTNRDHERQSDAFRRRLGVPVAAPALDASLLKRTPEQTFADNDSLPGGFRVVHLPNQKSPGESALHLRGRRMLVVGDALIGNPPGELNMLPDGKYAVPRSAREVLAVLAQFPTGLETILTGDGEPILSNAQEVLERFFVV